VTRLLVIALFPLAAHADALTDLRAALGQLTATTAVHGTYDIVSDSRDEDQAFNGKASVLFDTNEGGLRFTFPKALLAQATQEARTDTDGNRQTPTRSAVGRIRTLHVAELVDAAAFLITEIQTAKLGETRAGAYRGKPARIVVLKLTPKLSKAAAKRMKSMDATMTLWLGDDGVPIAADRRIVAKASVMLMSFETDQKNSWTFVRAGDRLVATHAEESNKSDGLGQHNLLTITENITLQ
jgi:hypothetical protein